MQVYLQIKIREVMSMKKISGSGCVSNSVRAGLAQRRRDKAQEGKTFEVYQIKKDGNFYAKPSQNHLGHTRFTMKEATGYVRHLENLNPGRKWVVKEVG